MSSTQQFKARRRQADTGIAELTPAVGEHKPHIRWSPRLEQWRCGFSDDGVFGTAGYGESQLSAYQSLIGKLHWFESKVYWDWVKALVLKDWPELVYQKGTVHALDVQLDRDVPCPPPDSILEILWRQRTSHACPHIDEDCYFDTDPPQGCKQSQ